MFDNLSEGPSKYEDIHHVGTAPVILLEADWRCGMGRVYYHVDMIEQGDENPICWIACVAMLTSWKTKAHHGIGEFTGGFEPSNSCIPDPNEGWEDLYDNLHKFGFEVDGPGTSPSMCIGANWSMAPSYIENMLRRHGPFMIFVNVVDFPFRGPVCVDEGADPDDTHAIVVSGVDTDQGEVWIVNPWGTYTPPADIDVVLKAMQDIADQDLCPVAYLK
jgi:hypothetical protein